MEKLIGILQEIITSVGGGAIVVKVVVDWIRRVAPTMNSTQLHIAALVVAVGVGTLTTGVVDLRLLTRQILALYAVSVGVNEFWKLVVPKVR